MLGSATQVFDDNSHFGFVGFFARHTASVMHSPQVMPSPSRIHPEGQGPSGQPDGTQTFTPSPFAVHAYVKGGRPAGQVPSGHSSTQTPVAAWGFLKHRFPSPHWKSYVHFPQVGTVALHWPLNRSQDLPASHPWYAQSTHWYDIGRQNFPAVVTG